MSERLERIEAQQEANTANIADLITLSSNVLQAAQLNAEANAELKTRASESDDRFNILVAEMRADRRAAQQAFQAMLLQLAEINERVDGLEEGS